MANVLNGYKDAVGQRIQRVQGPLKLISGEWVLLAFVEDGQGHIDIRVHPSIIENIDAEDVESFADGIRRTLLPLIRPKG